MYIFSQISISINNKINHINLYRDIQGNVMPERNTIRVSICDTARALDRWVVSDLVQRLPSLPSWWQSLPFLFPSAGHSWSAETPMVWLLEPVFRMSLLWACKSDNGRCNRCLSKTSRTRNALAHLSPLDYTHTTNWYWLVPMSTDGYWLVLIGTDQYHIACQSISCKTPTSSLDQALDVSAHDNVQLTATTCPRCGSHCPTCNCSSGSGGYKTPYLLF